MVWDKWAKTHQYPTLGLQNAETAEPVLGGVVHGDGFLKFKKWVFSQRTHPVVMGNPGTLCYYHIMILVLMEIR